MDAVTFQDLLTRLRAGDSAAATQLVSDYGAELVREVRFRLRDSRLRQRVDTGDICQSVWWSVFVKLATGTLDLADPQDLVRILMRKARNKVADEFRRQGAAQRDYRRTVPLAADVPTRQVDYASSWQALWGEVQVELRQRLSPAEWQLLTQRLQGQTWEQIGQSEGNSPEALRKRLERAIDTFIAGYRPTKENPAE